MQGDSNNIPFNSYNIDFFGAISSGFGGGDGLGAFFETIFGWAIFIWSLYTALALLLSLVLLFGIIYAYMRGQQFTDAEDEFIASAEQAYQQLYGTRAKNARWDEITRHASTDRPNDWKLAIIDADTMLYEALERQGYVGTSVGEKLRSASPQALQSLENAWQAHKVRNQIAHSGSDFVLTKRLSQETITQYRMVLEELNVL